MHARASFVPQIQSAKSMEPGERAFNDPARAAQAAAVGAAPFRQLAGDPASFECVAMGLRVIRPVSLHYAGLP